MNKFLEFLTKVFSFLFTIKTEAKPLIPPKPKPIQGLLSMDVACKDLVNKLFNNPMLIGALKGKVDLAKQFGLKFTCYIYPQSDQNFTVTMSGETIRFTFNKTCPRLYVEKYLEVEVNIDYLELTRDKLRVSLQNFPDYIIRFVDKV